MEIKKEVLLLAFFITLSLFLSLLLVGALFDTKRQQNIDLRFQNMYADLNDIQKIILISSAYNDTISCQAFSVKLSDMDKKIWDAGMKLEQYRSASEEFRKSQYYLDQKKVFNENELTYMMLLTQIKKKCGYNQPIISFFYQNSADCSKCDDQSYVLNDVKKELGNNVSIFSFDVDLNLTTISIVKASYAVDELPCVVINDKKFCGIKSKDFVMRQICHAKSNISACDAYT
jgi:hypothetical protein